jgi:acyl-CoA synthetase (AMP-forming)/AMP-acid ligase II
MATTVLSALDWWARTAGGRTALVFADDAVTYRELQAWSSRGADLLRERGVRPGDRVGVIGGNTAGWAVAAYAVLRAGAVLVPLNARLVPAELHKLLADAEATAVVADAAFLDVVHGANALGSRVAVVPLADVAAVRAGGDHAVRVDRAEGDPVAVLFTSGSTGLSKGVICTDRTLLDIVFEAMLREEGIHPGSRSLLVLPFSFTPGLVWGLLMSGVLGGTLVVEASLDPSRAVRLVEQHRIEVLFGVPLIYQAMAAAPEFAGADLGSVTHAAIGGAAVPVPLLEAWGAKGVKLRQIYGMTEIGGIATATLPEEAEEHPGSCGIGSVFTEFRVVRADGSDCVPGETGEVLLRGPGMTPGYWNDPQSTARAFEQGWLHSGDLGMVDADGRLTFVDRLKDLIISGGINVSPIEIEMVIAQIPGVVEVAVIPAKDDRFGETPAAIVTTSGPLTEDDVVRACAEQVADYKVPRYVVIRDEPLPRLPSGKVSKRDIKTEYDDITERFPRVR